jgi:GT2 family glycosyltransferase
VIPVLILSRNNLELTKACVESVNKQDVETRITLFDNGSTDGTVEWGRQAVIDLTIREFWECADNRGVSKAWNFILARSLPVWKKCLVLNNDAVIPPWFVRRLDEYDLPFVTGVAVDHMPTEPPPPSEPVPHPDFSAFMIRLDCWEKVGEFDEEMVFYVQDCDYHVRAHRLGVPLVKVNLPYYHVNSQTFKRARPEEQRWIEERAIRDRRIFERKYGCNPGTPEYEKLFT